MHPDPVVMNIVGDVDLLLSPQPPGLGDLLLVLDPFAVAVLPERDQQLQMLARALYLHQEPDVLPPVLHVFDETNELRPSVDVLGRLLLVPAQWDGHRDRKGQPDNQNIAKPQHDRTTEIIRDPGGPGRD